ncbi:MAG: helix-turn-helix transcriptional regulator [Lachnospiraceae bacterium]|nr:helix-turn-helix transcriptional regulator [Lachnospiraceae bacterium]
MRYYQYEKYPIELVVSENIDKHFDSHNHVGHYVSAVVIQGVVTVYQEGREWVCHGGDIFIIPPYVVHSVCQGRDVRLLSMCMETAFIEETDLETAEGIVRAALEDAVAQEILGEVQKEKLLASVREVFHIRNKSGKEMDAGIKILADKITSHPEYELSVETMAAESFVSKYYLIRKFKRNVGMTPHRFCIQNRIRKAQGLLHGKKAIGRIAADMGFYDQSHFDKAFQKIVGISPSEYVDSKRLIQRST